jgi:hypothetical protein
MDGQFLRVGFGYQFSSLFLGVFNIAVFVFIDILFRWEKAGFVGTNARDMILCHIEQKLVGMTFRMIYQ